MLNTQIFYFFYNFAHKSFFFDGMVLFFSQYFPYLVILLAIIFMLFHHEVIGKGKPFKALFQKWKEIFFISLSVLVAWLFAILLKVILHIPRPFIEFQNIVPLLKPTDFSFPSGHAAFFMALAVAIFLCHKKAGLIFIIFALIIGISRIVAGVHYPVDILGGFLFGGLISYLLIKSFKK